MIRTCDGTDPNLHALDGSPCSCGLHFDDVERMVVFPHRYVGGEVRALQNALNEIAGDPEWRHRVVVPSDGWMDRRAAEAAFLAASIAVWREIDRLDSEPGGYHPTRMSVELRERERAAWKRYRDLLEPGDA